MNWLHVTSISRIIWTSLKKIIHKNFKQKPKNYKTFVCTQNGEKNLIYLHKKNIYKPFNEFNCFLLLNKNAALLECSFLSDLIPGT